MNGYAVTAAAKYAEESDSRQMVKPKKRQGWIKRWFSRSTDNDNNSMNGLAIRPAGIERGEPQIDQPDRAIQFTIYTANGGRVIETRRYDRQRDRSQTGLYVITNDKDFGHEIDKIITMESLK
jgi:hypothetical protein